MSKKQAFYDLNAKVSVTLLHAAEAQTARGESSLDPPF